MRVTAVSAIPCTRNNARRFLTSWVKPASNVDDKKEADDREASAKVPCGDKTKISILC